MRTGLQNDRRAHPAGARLRRAAAALILAGTALSACKSNEVVTGSLPEDGYRTRYPIVLAEAPENLDIPVGMGAGGLGRSTRDNVRAFAAEAAEKGTGSLVVLVPSGSANETVAAYLARDIKAEAQAGGLPPALIETRPYRVDDPNATAPIRLTYSRIKAVSPPCGQWTSDILPDAEKGTDGAEFGCATQANLAAMVANPNDLITPRVQTPLPAWRRWEMLKKYRTGESPSGTYEQPDASATSGGN
jgi:pilus assembly protein CpaD